MSSTTIPVELRRILTLLVAITITIAIGVLTVQIQPAGQSRVARRGRTLRVEKGRILWRTTFGGE